MVTELFMVLLLCMVIQGKVAQDICEVRNEWRKNATMKMKRKGNQLNDDEGLNERG